MNTSHFSKETPDLFGGFYIYSIIYLKTYMNFKDTLFEILLESNKMDVLINKIGLSQKLAKTISDICGPLSVFLTNKILEDIKNKDTTTNTEITKNKNYHVNILNGINFQQYKQLLTSIMDWVRVGLNGNINQYKNLTLIELYTKSKEWHESLEIGGGDINYVEENDIILDFRNNDGIGFYWADLNTNNSPEECDRMGHCGRTNFNNTIISLRQTIKLNDKYTLNKSHLTAALSDEGQLKQLKGQKNSKPKPEYHNYIIPFILEKVTSFGSEYDSSNDFKLFDLTKEQIKFLYQKKPTLFTRYNEKSLLWKIGVTEKPKNNFTLEIRSDNVGKYVDGDWVVNRIKNKNDVITKEYTFFEKILKGESYDLYDSYSYDGDWQDALYYVDKNNEKFIWDLLNKKSKEDDIDINGLSIEDAIDELDYDEIKNVLRWSKLDAESNDYINHMEKKLKESLGKYGEIIEFGYDGVKISVDLDNFVDDLDGDYIEDCFDRCNGDVSCVFNEFLGDGYVDIPKFFVDDRWSPDIDKNDFNQNLKDRLDDEF